MGDCLRAPRGQFHSTSVHFAWRLVHRRGERANRWRQAGYDFGMRRLAGSFDRDLPGLPRGRAADWLWTRSKTRNAIAFCVR